MTAADLRRGEHLIDADGGRIAVDAVLDLERETWVYNLTVAGLHTYYAGADPVLVHNAARRGLSRKYYSCPRERTGRPPWRAGRAATSGSTTTRPRS